MISDNESKWGNMQHDVLVKILMELDMFDLLKCVSSVCVSWRDAVHDPILWRKVDFTRMTMRPEISRQGPYWSDQCSKERFMHLLKTIGNYSDDAITCLYFSYSVYLDDDHFTFATKRFPNVKHLLLPGWDCTQEPAFLTSLARYKHLESIIVSSSYSPFTLIQCLSKHCLNLTKLKLLCTFDSRTAQAIFTYLPNLKVLSLRSSVIYKEALLHILDNATVLNSLNISHCLVLEATMFPIEWVNTLSSLDPRLISKMRRFERFVWCDKRTCTRCLRMFVENNGGNKWVEFQEDVWREDEFIEFCL